MVTGQVPFLENRVPAGRMNSMTSIKGHFDGHAVVLDEPATLAVGQEVRVIFGTMPDEDRDIADMTDDELAECLEVEKHKMRGVPYEH